MSIEQDDTAWAFPAVKDPAPAGESCPDENLLVRLAEGVLEGLDRSHVDRHLDTCPDCTLLVAELARLAAPARNAPKRYKVIRQLGAGAMGVVWEAEDTNLQRRVALKFVKPEGADDGRLRKRLLREARALAQVRHPNVVSVYDAGEADDEVCLVLELVTGTHARAWRTAGARSTAEIVDVWKQAAAGIAAVHKAGIVHRDIKPDNVFVSDDRRVLVGDFGLATGGGVNTTTSLTVTGAVIGTPLYMSPEQLQGDVASAKSDQFALCASFWEALLDERPFRGTTIAAIVLAMTKVPEIPKSASIEQRRILAILQRGLDPEPSARFPDVDTLIAALDLPARPSRKPLWIALGAIVLAVGATVAVLAATRGASPDTTPPLSPTANPTAPTSPTTNPPGTPTSPTTNQTAGTPSPTTNQTAGSPSPTSPSPNPVPSPTANPVPSPTNASPNPVPSPTTKPSPTPPPKPGVANATPPSTPYKNPYQTVQPSSPPAPGKPDPQTTEGSFTNIMSRAADKLQFGDGAGCLKLLATLPEVPNDSMVGVEQIRIHCRMATGDCIGATTAMQTFGKARGWDDARIKLMVETGDRMYCPITAEPKSRQPERAQYRLTILSAQGRSCKPVLDAIAKHNIVLPDPKQAVWMEIQCMVNDGACAAAKAKYIQNLIPANIDPTIRPRLEEGYDKSFHQTYNKKCPSA